MEVSGSEVWQSQVRKGMCGVARNLATIVLFGVLAGCGSVADIRAEQRAEALARKYGERLPESELGPYKGFTREEFFKHKCDTEAGEFIYKTVENVESVYQMRTRDPRDLIHRLRRRDIPEDPWGHTNTDARQPYAPFMRKYRYFETSKGLEDRGDHWNRDVFASRPDYEFSRYWRYSLGEPDGKEYRLKREGESVTRPFVAQRVDAPKSRYGYTWRETRDRYDRHFGVWGGELIVMDLKTGETLAVKRGYFDSRYEICPKGDGGDRLVYRFVTKVLRPKMDAKQ